MATVDERVEVAVSAILNAAFPAMGAEGRKILSLREGESVPCVKLACAYDRETPGENGEDERRNVFYSLIIVFFTRSNLGSTGDELLNQWREAAVRLLYGPTLAGVDEVDDIKFIRLPAAVVPPQPAGIDTQALQFEIETFEPIGV